MPRQPTKREILLLVILLTALIVIGGGFGFRILLRHIAEQRAGLLTETLTLEEARAWVLEKDVWEQKIKWLASNALPPYGGEDTDFAFAEDAQIKLKEANIEILDQKLQKSKHTDDIVEVSMDLVLSSTLEQLVRWLQSVQKPGAFRTVSHLKLQSDADSSKIRAELSLVQFYAASRTP